MFRIATMAVAFMLGSPVAQAAAAEVSSVTLALLDELRGHFTLGSEPVPPQIFRDFGDGNLADSSMIWVTIDVLAAKGSNLYGDPIEKTGGWVKQSRPAPGTLNGRQETDYRYIGVTGNELIVALASYSGGGSGTFYTLHLLDAAPAVGFDSDGMLYDRILLTDVRDVVLGDRWQGEIQIDGNTVEIATVPGAPGEAATTAAVTRIDARRP